MPVKVVAPATYSDLVRVKTRSRLGGFELAERFPKLAADERGRKDYAAALRIVAFRPWLWPQATAYLWINIVCRWRARVQCAAGARWSGNAILRPGGGLFCSLVLLDPEVCRCLRQPTR